MHFINKRVYESCFVRLIKSPSTQISTIFPSLNLKNDDLKAELQKAGKDHSAILSKAGYEIKHNLDLYRRDNSGVQNIKADVKQIFTL